MEKKTAAKSKQQRKNKKPDKKNWENKVKEQIPPGRMIPDHLARQAPA